MKYATRVCAAFVVLGLAACTGVPPRPRPGVGGPVIEQWARFEARYVPDERPSNPFDPSVIDVRAVFRGPDGRVREVLAFWYQDFERSLVDGRERLSARGNPHFVVRFTPDTPGRWAWRWVVRTPGLVERTPDEYFHVRRSRAHGFLRVSGLDARQLAFDDGSPYFAVGENTGWYDARGTYAYDDWFGELATQGANFGRVWMSSWAFGIEWDDTGLGDYTERLDRAWQLDHVLDTARRRGIYVLIALLNHGAFSTRFNSEWASNPYNAVNGGPLTSPAQFFTDAMARRLFEQRLRYVVARWGWSPNVLAWEFWNEVDLTDGYAPATVAAWHRDMAALLRHLDPHDHLVTTSHAFFGNSPAVWRDGGLDFTQVHLYADTLPAYRDIGETVVTLTRDRLATTGRPVLFGELGVDSRGPAETRAADPGGIGVHDGLWAGVVSGGFGTAMTWWWDNLVAVEPNLYYPMFGSVARFVDGVRWDAERFQSADASVTASRPVVARGLAGERTLLLWLKDGAYQWFSPDAVEVHDAVVTVEGSWCGAWYDTWSGDRVAAARLAGPTPVPRFARDLAVRAERCPVTGSN